MWTTKKPMKSGVHEKRLNEIPKNNSTKITIIESGAQEKKPYLKFLH